jgi:hypothetical protein
MRIRYRFSSCGFLATALLSLAACASSTGILPAGPDSYTVTEKLSVLRGGADGAKATALTEADAYCRG